MGNYIIVALLCLNVAANAVYFTVDSGREPFTFGLPWWCRIIGQGGTAILACIYIWRGGGL